MSLKKHHTAEEVAAERQSKLDAKEEKERTKRASIKHVAQYEKNQADQDVMTNATPCAAPPKPKPIPSKRKAVVAPPATKKAKAKANPLQTEDGAAAEMDDAAADSSAFNPDPTQHSGMVTSDIDTDGSDSEMLSSPPRKKTKVSGKKAGKMTKSSSKAADRKKAAPHSTISLNSDDSNDSDDSDILVVDATPKKAPSKQPASVQPDDDAMSIPAAHLNNNLDEPITSHPPGRQPSQWTMPVLSEYDCGATPIAGAPGRVDKKGKGNEKEKEKKEKGKADLADDKKISISHQAHSDEKRIPLSSKSDLTPNGKDFSTGINNWAASIPKNAKPSTKATTSQPSIFKNSTSSHRLPP
ncbi:uncharacterized protein EDB93DRAFT_1258974 [Suillus bovinus]|uniref:uncharacterized protein n=1 Tax=Suillus bovinus TaxID=48563 RepID=UPI001B8863E5|nr:uncharacterized protein EDB93DRAFT_1258974 [Suillus bovinus]KAG2123980.1 hypothetical protein EDB93DRAFT_1258974 [Suillus bovinus]